MARISTKKGSEIVFLQNYTTEFVPNIMYGKISCITRFVYNMTPLVQTLKCGTKFLSLV